MQIRRYVYKDVVRVQDIHDHMDTTGIQTYINNSAKVVFLRDRPHNNINKVPKYGPELLISQHAIGGTVILQV